MRACVLLKDTPHYRRDAFVAGLQVAGHTVVTNRTFDPRHDDCLLIWNRYGHGDHVAKQFEAAKARVYVAENCYMGNDWQGGQWYTISKNNHNTGSVINKKRWVWPFGERPAGDESEIILLPQRGIGPPGIAMPGDWTNRTSKKLTEAKIPHRIRKHPGINKCTPLIDDLKNAFAVVTWGSGAALKAMYHGIPVITDFPEWIGQTASTPLGYFLKTRCILDDRDRLPVFDDIASSIFTLDEIAGGEWCRY